MGRQEDVSPDRQSGVPADRAAPYERLERYGKGSWWALGLVVLVAVGFYLLQRFGSFIVPSVIGIVLATTLSPVVAWMERRRVPRLLGAVIVSLVIVLLLLLFAWALGGHRRGPGPADLAHALGGVGAASTAGSAAAAPPATRWRGSRRSSGGCGRAPPGSCPSP